MGYCTNCGQPLEGESGFCSYCGAEHSADGEVALPGGQGRDLDTGGTVLVTPKSGGTVPMASKPTQPAHVPPRFQTETVPTRGPAAPAPQGQGRSRNRAVVIVAIMVIIVACAAAAAIVLFGRDSGASSAAVPSSPTPAPTATGVVKITSLREGNEVVGGQKLRVTVLATDVVGMKHLQLLVDGVQTGPTKEGVGLGDSTTASFPWRPPAKGGDVNLAVEAVLEDGTFVRSEVVSIDVRAAVAPTPTVTVTATAEPVPTYGPSQSGSGDKSGGELSGSFVVLISSETTYGEAEVWFNRLQSYGWENAGILRSDDYDLIAGYYCPYVGPYYSYTKAEEALRSLKADGLGERPRIGDL